MATQSIGDWLSTEIHFDNHAVWEFWELESTYLKIVKVEKQWYREYLVRIQQKVLQIKGGKHCRKGMMWLLFDGFILHLRASWDVSH